MLFRTVLLVASSYLLCSLVGSVQAYIPASPTNSSADFAVGKLNVTDTSILRLDWFYAGSYITHVSYGLTGKDTTGNSSGALVHFSEDMVDETTASTSTPWIALISCDTNGTKSSLETTIFDLARSKGAVAALLYSRFSQACIINSQYSDPATFNHIFDIFATQTNAASKLVEFQFGQLSGDRKLVNYDAETLDDLSADMAVSVKAGVAISEGFLLASLSAFDATKAGSAGGGLGGAPSSNVSSSSATSSTSPSASLSPSTTISAARGSAISISGLVSTTIVIIGLFHVAL